MKKFCIIFGTRPEYIKLKPIIQECQERQLSFQVIYVQQHENLKETIDSDYKTLSIEPNHANRLSNIGESILNKLPDHLTDCDYLIIQGDTATAFYSSIVAFQMNKKIAHVEAGLRTFDLSKPFPEEGYRQMISRIATVNFTPHPESFLLLKSEGVCGDIINVGNTILDSVQKYNLYCELSNFVIITYHRRENWDKIHFFLEGLLKLVCKTPNLVYYWYLHPNPDLQKKVKITFKNIKNVHLKEQCDHETMLRLISKAKFIITDSGGIQEEASFLQKHSIVLRDSTERTHINKDYITLLKDFTKLDQVYLNIPNYLLPKCTVYGDGTSSKKIINYLTMFK